MDLRYPLRNLLVKEDLVELVRKFTPATASSEIVSITDFQPVASYSWVEANASNPTIAVPAFPPIWTNANPSRVPPDSGMTFIDQCSYRTRPNLLSPLSPLFAAVEDLHPEGYDYASLDIVTERNNLRKLLRWATGRSGGEDFRIDLEVAGETCLFTRREETDCRFVTGFVGFGREYEKKSTRLAKGCERTVGHYRICSMNFGGLKILIRYEVDACTDDPEIEDLTAAISLPMTVRPTPSHHVPKDTRNPPFRGLTIVRTSPRTLAPQSTIVELKTRAEHRPLRWHEVYPQLYLSQTTWLFVAAHVNGMLQKAEKFKLGNPEMSEYAKEAEEGMARLRKVLGEVLTAAREDKSGAALSLICHQGELGLYKRQEGTGRMVGKEILSRFT